MSKNVKYGNLWYSKEIHQFRLSENDFQDKNK